MRKAAGLAAAVFLVGAGCAESGKDAENHSTAYKLYVLDTGDIPLDESADELRPYRRQLLLLSERCTNPEGRLGDFAFAIKQQLGKDFVDVSTLDVMQAANAALDIGGDQARQDCKDEFALAGVALQETN
jgi:hypothetical protein